MNERKLSWKKRRMGGVGLRRGFFGEYFEFMDGWMDDWKGICEMDRKYIEKLESA